jgi:hypothetical protein
MAMDYSNVVKGHITQSLLKSLLERAGYRVTRLGVEEVFNEIIYLNEEKYRALNLPENLRFLPDLLVAEHNLERAFLVEVKFRKAFTEESAKSLYEELERQRKHWKDSYAVIMVANSWADDNKFHQDYIRVLRPDETEKLIDTKWIRQSDPKRNYECIWKALPKLNDVFLEFKWTNVNANAANADLITAIIKNLKEL